MSRMDWNSKEALRNSLFKETSAFDNSHVKAEVEVELPKQTIGPSLSEQFGKLASLIQEAIDATTDTDFLPPLEEALEIAKRHA